MPALTSALQPFCSSNLCHRAAIFVTPASVRGLGQSEAECLQKYEQNSSETTNAMQFRERRRGNNVFVQKAKFNQ